MMILALLDSRAGNDNQTIAVAEKLGDYQSVEIEFSFWSKLPNFILRRSSLGIKTNLSNLNPDIIIASGRKLARVSAIVKKQSGCKNFHLMNPQMRFKYFDHIFIPSHDRVKAKNVTITIGAANRIDANFLDKFKSPIKHLGRIAMLVGDIPVKDIPKKLANKNLHITTSRRTKPATIEALKKLEPASLYIYPNGENPYYNMLATAEKILVSADSIGMVSEACTTGKPVYIFGKSPKPKFKELYKRLVKNGYAKYYKEYSKKTWQPKILNTRDEIVKKIKTLLNS